MKPQPLAILFILVFGALVVVQNYNAQDRQRATERAPLQGKGEYETYRGGEQLSHVQIKESPLYERALR